MSINGQGQSIATIDKERCLASAFAIGMKIANGLWGGRSFKYWHFDANAGSGWNETVDVPGSPIVFHRIADIYLNNMQREAFFCDINAAAISDVLGRLGSWNRSSFVFQRDNKDVLEVFAERLRQSGEKKQYMIGSIIVDPNGYWYRSKDGKGPPIDGLLEFVKEFPRIDIILNLNTRWRRLALGHDWYQNDVPPRDVLSMLRKKFWLIKRTQYGGDEFMLAVGRNFETGDHKEVGFHKLDSEQGRFWMTMFEGGRQGGLSLDA